MATSTDPALTGAHAAGASVASIAAGKLTNRSTEASAASSPARGAENNAQKQRRRNTTKDDSAPIGTMGEALAIVSMGLSLFLTASMATFRVAYRPDASGENVCGFIGHALAGAAFVLFGKSAYVPAVFCVIWSAILFLRGRVEGAAVKAFGVAVFTVSLAIILEHALPFDRATGDPRGGLLGAVLHPYVNHGFGSIGTFIIMAIVASISFTMATDYAFVPLVREAISGAKRAGAEVRDRAVEMREAETWGQRALALVPGFLRGKNKATKDKTGDKDRNKSKEAAPAVATAPVRPATPLVINPPLPPTAPLKEEPLPPVKIDLRGGDETKSKDQDADATKNSATDASRRREAKPGDKNAAKTAVADSVQSKLPFPAIPYKLPEAALLDDVKKKPGGESHDDVRTLATRIEEVLKSFGVDVAVVGASRGPAVTLFELEMGEGITVNLITARRHDLAIRLKSGGVRFVYPIPGKSTVGVEVPNGRREFVRLREIVDEVPPQKVKSAVPLYLGRDVMNRAVVEDLSEMPHLLIAGQTGSGKSACLNAILCSVLLARDPEEVKLILIDPKHVEFSKYDGIPHLMCPIVTIARKVPIVLDWVISEMEERYELLAIAGMRKISDFNACSKKELKERMGENYDPEETRLRLSYLVVVVDEMNDLMIQAKKDMEDRITRIAQKSRAVGIHLILATQRPSVNVITGTIKANLPTRIAFQTAQGNDSRVILDQNGAEDLLGKGDFLYKPPGTDKFVRAQGTWVGDEEIERLVKHAKSHGEPKYDIRLIQIKDSDDSGSEGGDSGGQKADATFEGGWSDALFERAVEETLESNRAAASHLQRAFAIGYNRATRILDAMAQLGIVSQYEGSKVRRIMITKEEWSARKSELMAGPKRGGAADTAAQED